MTADRNWPEIALAPGAELVVGWRPKPDHLDAGTVVLAREMADSLRDLAVQALTALSRLTPRAFGGDPYIEPGEQYLSVPTNTLRGSGSPPTSGDIARIDDSDLLPELQRLVTGSTANPLSRTDLQAGRYLFYAVVCRIVGADERVGFVRQIDPHKVAKAGGVLAAFGDQGLHELSEPLFIFDTSFDLVITPDEIAVLRLEAFNRLFADVGILAQAAPGNARTVCSALGNVSDASVEILGQVAASRRSIARRLQRLARPGALPHVTAKSLRNAMLKHGLDPATMIAGNQFNFDASGAPTFVDLIEQLYYETDFSQEHRRADRYSAL